MKKLGLCVLALCGLVSLTGCKSGEISEAEGKVWAEQNGYVKVDNSLIGEYEFSHVIVDVELKDSMDRIFTSCPTQHSDFGALATGCEQGYSDLKVKITKDRITLSSDDGGMDEEYYYDEITNEIYVKAKKDEYSKLNVLVKDGNLLFVNKGTTPADGSYTYTVVLTKK